MKRLATTVALVLFGLTCFLGSASAADGKCNKLYSTAFNAMKKDKDCGKYASAYMAAIAKQRASCRQHRDNIRKCNMAKRHKAKACRGQKRKCKTVCKDGRAACKKKCTKGQRNCSKACPRGRKGKNCRKKCRQCVRSCNKLRRRCKKVCTSLSRPCVQAARREAHSCRSHARTLAVFKTCQDARAMSRKAGSKVAGCAWKHFGKALLCSAGDAIKWFSRNKK